MRNLTTLTLILLSLCVFGQEQPKLDRVVVKMWAVDSKNNADTVIFGYDKNATNGIDTQLGERNIIGQAYNNTLEIRGLQRKPENQICGQGGYAFYSDVDFETKINFRNILYPPNLFEFIVKGKNYPIQIYADFKELFDSTYYSSIVSKVSLHDSLCNTPIWTNLYSNDNLLLTIDNDKQYLVKINLNYIFDGLFNSDSNCKFKIFPTSVTDFLNIEYKTEYQNFYLDVYNSLGQTVLKQTFSANLKLDITTLKQGIYFVQSNHSAIYILRPSFPHFTFGAKNYDT